MDSIGGFWVDYLWSKSSLDLQISKHYVGVGMDHGAPVVTFSLTSSILNVIAISSYIKHLLVISSYTWTHVHVVVFFL